MANAKLVGVRYGEYEGNKYGRLEVVEKEFRNGLVGCRVYEDRCSYDLAIEIAKDWELYENQEVFLVRGRHDIVESVSLGDK